MVTTPRLTTIVVTKSGEVHTGILRKRSEKELQLLTAEGKLLRIPATDIEQTRKSDVSLMPEKLHEQMESTLDTFETIVAMAAQKATANGVAFSPSTVENIRALGLPTDGLQEAPEAPAETA